MGCCLHENLVWFLFLRTSGCGSIGGTLTTWSVGHVPILTGGGGNTFRDTGGTGFWHETHCMRGGMEAVYNDILQEIGFWWFAPVQAAKGALFTARSRAGRAGESTLPPAVTEQRIGVVTSVDPAAMCGVVQLPRSRVSDSVIVAVGSRAHRPSAVRDSYRPPALRLDLCSRRDDWRVAFCTGDTTWEFHVR